MLRSRHISVVLLLVAGCSKTPSGEPVAETPSAPVATELASATPAPEPAAATEPAEPVADVADEEEPEPPPEPEPVPEVDVKNIGMHIGGGPNDDVTKKPIKDSVSPHFDDLKRCWNNVDEADKGGTFGVDLRIDKEGGKAEVSHPRTSIKGDGFKECVLGVFTEIDFKKPKTGTTNVSYSLRFTP